MNRFALVLCLLPLLACSKGAETASNAATEYAKDLSQDTAKAQAAADAANRAIGETTAQADAARAQD